KFGGIVSDGAANMKLAKNLVNKKYPHILPVRSGELLRELQHEFSITSGGIQTL
ncbi:24034_t:CDS:2, partial [Dentiscutata erythropus]